MNTALTSILCPMRPTMGESLTPDNVATMLRDLRGGYIIQPKLNGDRVVLTKRAGTIECWNRHKGRYSFNVNAVLDWQGLPDNIILDGEGYRGKFYPFEVVGPEPVEDRVAEAKRLCRALGMPWIFDEPTEAWLRNCRDNLPQWEGVVCKKRGTGYTWLAKSNYTSAEWFKLKWATAKKEQVKE